jgi:lipoyl(octanoyl) transferase
VFNKNMPIFALEMEKLPKVIYQDLGHISYQEAWDYQFQLQKQVIEHKLAARKRAEMLIETANDTPSVSEPYFQPEQSHFLLFCEHNPVYTLGKSGSVAHLLLNETELIENGVEFFKINRGGDITYHGPGQITGYPIFDLDCFFTDVHKYVRFLEEAVIRTLADYGLEGMRIAGYTGVWLQNTEGGQKRKICAIGVHLSRWVTMHGFAFNVNTALNYFKNIVPCGIAEDDKTVTSLAAELGRKIDMEEVKDTLKRHFAALFQFEYSTKSQ